jgi:glucose/arabinose dehydrogenase
VKLTRIGTFDAPLYVTQPPGDRSRLFVVQQGGKIVVVRRGHALRTPFLDVTSKIVSGGEQGLLGLAFAPDYARSRRFYVFYTDVNGDERLVEYRPDGLLYIGIGDGGGGDDQHGPIGNGQNLGTMLGKILRIDPRPSGSKPYTVPRDNPFVGRAGAKPAIYAYGLRNPWRFSFDRATGDIAIGDVGQDHVEEIDFRTRGNARGVNFGWRAWEGTRRVDPGLRVPDAAMPVLQYTHDRGGCSVTGGYVIRDRRLPALNGRYVYGDFCAGDLFTAKLRQDGARGRRSTGLHVDALSSFGEDQRGRVYVTSLSGPVYRLDPR